MQNKGGEQSGPCPHLPVYLLNSKNEKKKKNLQGRRTNVVRYSERIFELNQEAWVSRLLSGEFSLSL